MAVFILKKIVTSLLKVIAFITVVAGILYGLYFLLKDVPLLGHIVKLYKEVWIDGTVYFFRGKIDLSSYMASCIGSLLLPFIVIGLFSMSGSSANNDDWKKRNNQILYQNMTNKQVNRINRDINYYLKDKR